MTEIIPILRGEIVREDIKEFVMKKDNELPLVIRLARWSLFAFCFIYGSLVLLEKAMEMFP